MRAAAIVIRLRRLVLLAWVLAAGVLWLGVGRADPAANESATYLPPEVPSEQAFRRLREHFPHSVGLSEAVVVFERRGGPLRAEDLEAIERAGARIADANASSIRPADLEDIHVRTPASIPLPGNPMVSPASAAGQAALIVVNVPVNFITTRSSRVVQHIRQVLQDQALPEGLAAEVTGSSAYGHDYAQAARRSSERTAYVTLAAVLVILAAVYRAPLAALVPLGAVSLAAAVVLKGLDLFSHSGLHAGTAERTFVFVLLYGAGTDYSLLLISRCREFLGAGLPPDRAAAAALGATYPAILGSGTTNAAGLLTLGFASFRIFRTTGPAVAMAMGVALLAAGTLIPALLAVMGRAVFWPRRSVFGGPSPAEGPAGPAPAGLVPSADPPAPARSLWERLAEAVTAHPKAVLATCLLALAAPVACGARVHWVYDQLASLGPRYGAIRGKDMIQRHWSIGQMAPLTILAESSRPLDDPQWRALTQELTETVAAIDGVQDVRSLPRPLGGNVQAAARRESGPPSHGASSQPASAPRQGLPWLTDWLADQAARAEYLSADGRAARLVVVLAQPAWSLEAMRTAQQVIRAARQAAGRLAPSCTVHLAGATPQMADLSNVTRRDFRRIAPLALGLIFLIVLALLRRPLLCLFMVGCTVLSYLATLGMSDWVFRGLLHRTGLDWKVQVFLFVVMVAVGVDYSIFLAARLREESRTTDYVQAIRRAIVHTGPVISSCGVIMAASLGSLMAGDLKLLHQLGFALALGMLLDTFVVRPLLLPAFATLRGPRRPDVRS